MSAASRNATQDRLVIALGLALEEIHHPGAMRHIGVDITALIEGVIKEARKQGDIPQMIRDEIMRRAKSAA